MATTPKKPKAAGTDTQGLRIVAKRDGFRRAGFAFGGEATTLSLAELTPDQVEQLMTEPMLVVTEVEIKPYTQAA